MKRKSTESEFTHLDRRGRAAMVDVGGKPETRREAVAEAWVTLSAEAFRKLASGEIAKGDVYAVVRIAGIQAAKRTADWIPLAHPLAVEKISVEIEPDRAGNRVRIVATAVVTGRTGVEMEALVAASAGALALYDMCKAIDKGIVIGPVRLLRKTGGKSGTWEAGPVARKGPPATRRRG